MRIAICDDEAVQCELLTKYLKEWSVAGNIPLGIETFAGAEQFLFHWEDDKAYDLLILDIEMGSMNGMELAMKLRSEQEEIPILFVTGYDKYIGLGYEVSALHYLLKQLQKEKLFAVLDRLERQQREQKTVQKILLQTEDGPLTLPFSDIWYVEASGHECVLYTKEKSHKVLKKISDLAGMFAEKKEMVQCHRSYLVNLQHVSAIVKSELVLDNRARLPLSRSANKKVNEAFMALYR